MWKREFRRASTAALESGRVRGEEIGDREGKLGLGADFAVNLNAGDGYGMNGK